MHAFKRLTAAGATAALLFLPATAAMANDAPDPAPATQEGTFQAMLTTFVSQYFDGVLSEEQSQTLVAAITTFLDDLMQTFHQATQDEQVEEPDDTEEPDTESLDAEDDTHGEMVSAIAQCAPSGRDLFGTGLNHGMIVSSVARDGEVSLPAVQDPESENPLFEAGTFTITNADEANAFCDGPLADFLAANAEVQAEATDSKAKGRPDHADKSNDDAEELSESNEVETENDTDEGDQQATATGASAASHGNGHGKKD